MKKRKDGYYQKKLIINNEPIHFYGKTQAEIFRKIQEYKEPIEKGITFKEAAEAWKEHHYENISYTTQKGYSTAYNRAIERFGEEHIKEITTQEIQEYINELIKKKYSHKTVKTHLLIISLVMKNNYKHVPLNPCMNVNVPKNLPKTKRLLPSEEEIEKVKNSCDKHFGFFAYLLLYTGLRRGEALALKWDDIDTNKNVVRVNKSVYFKNNQAFVKTPKTVSGNRDVILIDVIKSKKIKQKGYIFQNEKGLLSEQAFRLSWKRYLNESGVTITPHQLRHAFATLLYDAGIDVKTAQYMLGHANAQTTLDIYTHISESRQSDTQKKLNEYINEKIV